jgi:hypothetical protein
MMFSFSKKTCSLFAMYTVYDIVTATISTKCEILQMPTKKSKKVAKKGHRPSPKKKPSQYFSESSDDEEPSSSSSSSAALLLAAAGSLTPISQKAAEEDLLRGRRSRRGVEVSSSKDILPASMSQEVILYMFINYSCFVI